MDTFVYIDNILIASPTYEQHLLDVEEVLRPLQVSGLVISPSKWEFGKSTVYFLGHVVSESSCFPLPEKVEAIQGFPEPGTIQQLQEFQDPDRSQTSVLCHPLFLDPDLSARQQRYLSFISEFSTN